MALQKVICRSSLYILDMSSLSDISIINNLFHSVAYLYIFYQCLLIDNLYINVV